jgi:ferrous iron transport protein B
MFKDNIKNKRDISISCHDNSPHISANKDTPVITLVGQPNSGKTTLFNVLTNSNYKTSNYPGATVEFSTGNLILKYNFQAVVLDSPGIISINPRSPDEIVTIKALYDHPNYGIPELIIVTVDCTQISRQLFLARQLIEAGFSTIVAITMHDLLTRKNLDIDIKKLEAEIGCPVVIVNSRQKTGIDELVLKSIELINNKRLFGIKNILKPTDPDEENIINLYNFSEAVERTVLIPKNKIDINKINEKVFNANNRKPDLLSIKLDKFFLHPFWGLLTFIVSMGLIFTSIFWIAQPAMDAVDSLFGTLSQISLTILPEGSWITDLVSNGIISGIGSVAIFLPQIIILFILLGLLEDTGYLARSAMIIDKPLSWFGLNGRSFIPMLSGYACAIPAMMAARTITNRKERLLTIFIIPLMSCSARLPVYALLLAFVIPPDKPWIGGIALGAIYLFSLISGSIAAGIINKFKNTNEISSFMLELPAYRKPILKHVLKNTYYKSSMYLKSAGPTIVIISLVLWCLTYFPNVEPNLPSEKTAELSNEEVTALVESERVNTSFASYLGRTIEPVLKPAGWDWRIGVSLISAFAAREVFVSALAITLSVTDTEDENLQNSIERSMREAKLNGTDDPLFTTASTISLIVFFMFAMQCLSTIAVSKKETGSWRIPILQLSIYTPLAYLLAVVIFNSLKLLGVN